MAISHLVKELDINYEETFAERTRLLNFSNNKAKEDELEKGIERVKKDPEKLATDDKETSGILGALSVAIGIVVKLVKKMISFIIDKIKSISKYAKMLRDLGKAMWNSCWKGSLKKTAKRTKNISSKLKSFKGKGSIFLGPAIIAGIAAVVSGLVYSIITNKKPEEEKQEKEEQSSPSPEAGGGASGGAGASGDFSLTPPTASPTPVESAPASPTATPTPAVSIPAPVSPTATPTPAAPTSPSTASSASKSESTAAPEAAVSAAPVSKSGEPVEAEDPKTQSEKQIKGSGIKVRPTGDVWQGGPLSKTAVGVALAIQNQVKGFLYYTGLNDAYHKRELPNSQHAVGQGLDFVLDHMPSVKESQAIKEQIKLIAGVNPSQVMNE